MLALPGDDVSSGPGAIFWLVLVGLTWSATARRSFVAWGILVALVAVALVILPAAIIDGYGAAGPVSLALSLLALLLLLWPASRAHVMSSP
jgi:VIT1/CCC1 family predicted Fe2+/Mn2+ transporter